MDLEEGGVGGRKGGASLWSGLKQMFHGRPRGTESSRLESSTYSCLGHSNNVEIDETYGLQSSALSRNISYSHESVFQMDPHHSQGPAPVPASPKLRPTTSSVALPSLVHTELLTVLAERQYCGQAGPRRLGGKVGSEVCLTDEEDLGLPASLQNSPADYTRSLHSSRHHSSCSDNSLLSLDSEHGVTDSGAESLGSGQVGQLNHLAARHKMAVRPKRNHAVRSHRRLQQLTEEQEPSPPPAPAETALGSIKNKSKSLDKIFLELSPSSSQLREMAREESNKGKTKQKAEQDGNFLSRLFGSKRLRLKTSVSKKEPVGGVGGSKKAPAPAPADVEPQPQVSPGCEVPAVERSERVTPPRHKQKPPPPPPPDTAPPPGYQAQQGVQVLPPLPTNRSDIIMKKKTLMEKEKEGSHEKFQTSVQNWSLANEGRVRSLVSLNERGRPTQSLSSESLATITSLLEEPDLLEHTNLLTAASQEEPPADDDDLNGEAECYRTEKQHCETSDENHLITEPGHQDEREQSQETLEQIPAETPISVAGETEATGDNQVNEIQPATTPPTTTIGGGVGGVEVFPVETEGPEPVEKEELIEESENLTAVNKMTTTIPTLAEIIASTAHNDDSAASPESRVSADNDGNNDNDKKGNDTVSTVEIPHSPEQDPAPPGPDPVKAAQKMTEGESQESVAEKDNSANAGEENETTSKCDQVNIKRKPEISPKPVPAPRTFFLRPSSKSSATLESGGTNELLTVFARRSTSVSDVEDLKTSSCVVPPTPPAEVPSEDKAETRDQEINVKERAKSFSGLQTYQLGPRPFRPLSVTAEKDAERPKPKVAQKPTPAPRQMRSFPRLEKANNYPGPGALRTVKSGSALGESRQESQTAQVPSSDKNLSHKDEYNLDDIQVRKIADKFQRNTPPKPVRKSAPSPPSKKEEEENPEKKNVMNIVTKLNSMVVL